MTSLSRYAAEESPQKIANAPTARAVASMSERRPAKISPAKTRRFFVHCSGRAEWNSSATCPRRPTSIEAAGEGDGRVMDITPSPAALHVRRRVEAAYGVGFAVVGLEYGQQLGDGEQIGDPLRQAEQLQRTALPADGGIGSDQLTKTGAVDIGDLRQIQD